jgi:uncharacterized membrane protein
MGYLATAAVICVAMLRGIFLYLVRLFAPSGQQIDSTETIRLTLGRVLALSFEFSVASNILCVVVAPTRQDILNPGAIVLLRTLLNYWDARPIRASSAVRFSR